MSNGNLSSALSQPLRTYNMHWFGLRAATMQCSWSNYRGVKRLAQGHNGDGLACTYNWYKYNGHLIEKHPPKGFSDEMHNTCVFFSTSILLQEWLNISCYSSSSSLASWFLLWVSFFTPLSLEERLRTFLEEFRWNVPCLSGFLSCPDAHKYVALPLRHTLPQGFNQYPLKLRFKRWLIFLSVFSWNMTYARPSLKLSLWPC